MCSGRDIRSPFITCIKDHCKIFTEGCWPLDIINVLIVWYLNICDEHLQSLALIPACNAISEGQAMPLRLYCWLFITFLAH